MDKKIFISDRGISVLSQSIIDGPQLVKRHIDGPYITWAGFIKWLSFKERFMIWKGYKTVDDVAAKEWPELVELRENLMNDAIKNARG